MPVSNKPIELTSKSLIASVDGVNDKNYIDPTTITELETFIQTGIAGHAHKGNFIIKDDDGDFISLKEHKCAFVGRIIKQQNLEYAYEPGYWQDRLIAKALNGRRVLLADGDEGEDAPHDGSVTVSYNTIEQMINQTKRRDWSGIYQYLADGTLIVSDFTEDQKIDIKDKITLTRLRDKKIKKEHVKPPRMGLTALQSGKNWVWHQAAFVVFRVQRKSGVAYYIMGQDDGSYFCSELDPKTYKTEKNGLLTVENALKALTPPEVPHGTVRQGEWYFVPVDYKKVPPITECAAFWNDADYEAAIVLPVEDEDSNHHKLAASECRITKDGTVYAKNPNLSHDQHGDTNCVGWCKFVRNTALRSFSTEGVD